MNRSSFSPAAIIAILVVIGACCICLPLAAVAGITIFNVQTQTIQDILDVEEVVGDPTATPVVIRPTQPALPTRQPGGDPETTPDPEATTDPFENPGGGTPLSASQITTETLATLEESIVPVNDLKDLAERLEGKPDVPETVEAQPPLEVGAQDNFWVTDSETNQNFEVNATLRYVTDHLYFWIQDGVEYNEQALADLANTFENEIYPTNREFFGSEWTPGVDNDPHLYVVYVETLGGTVAGYFSSADEYHPDAGEFSNAHEMFFLSSNHIDFEEEFAYGVLAHEFQHMIHWYRDRNEDTWLNEGFAELAMFLNGYDAGGHDFVFSIDPDIQLNDWATDPEARLPHYGAAFMFTAYFLDRFGEEATQALVAHDANGMVSIDEVLAGIGATDPETGEPVTADDVFADWVVANYLQDSSAGDGRYIYNNYPNAPQVQDTETVENCPQDNLTRDVSQYGADYIRINCDGDYTLTFEGSMAVNVVPENPHSGQYAFWSNKGDESDMTLTQSFDLRSVSGPVEMRYWTWYDLEEDYDYLFLVASTDGGETWQILQTPSGTDEDPSGNSYGWGYNGQSGGWIEERVDLSQFSGQEVILRFEYVTDGAVNGEGFLLDDVSIPAIGYTTDFENDDGGWESAGWARIQNLLPQTFRLSLIRRGQETTVETIEIPADNAVEIPLSIGGDTDEVVLVVSGTTRFTRQKAAYRINIQP